MSSGTEPPSLTSVTEKTPRSIASRSVMYSGPPFFGRSSSKTVMFSKLDPAPSSISSK